MGYYKADDVNLMVYQVKAVMLWLWCVDISWCVV